MNSSTKDKVDDLIEKTEKRFEIVEKGKKEAFDKKVDKIDKIFERRKNKDDLKHQVLTDKNINHQMLKEIHHLRQSNVQVNLQKTNERQKRYQEELAMKLEIQKLQIAADLAHRKTARQFKSK